MCQVHIWNKTTCRTVKYYTTVHRRKYQLHFKNVVKSIITFMAQYYINIEHSDNAKMKYQQRLYCQQ